MNNAMDEKNVLADKKEQNTNSTDNCLKKARRTRSEDKTNHEMYLQIWRKMLNLERAGAFLS